MKEIILRQKPSFVAQIDEEAFTIRDLSKRNQNSSYELSHIKHAYLKKEEINVGSSLITILAHAFLPLGSGFGKVIKEVPKICFTYKEDSVEIFLDSCDLAKAKECVRYLG